LLTICLFEVFEEFVYFISRFLGKGLLTEPKYELWKPRRSLYDPAFSKVYWLSLLRF